MAGVQAAWCGWSCCRAPCQLVGFLVGVLLGMVSCAAAAAVVCWVGPHGRRLKTGVEDCLTAVIQSCMPSGASRAAAAEVCAYVMGG